MDPALESPLYELNHASIAVGLERYLGRLTVHHGSVVFDPRTWNDAWNFEPATRIVHRDHRLTVVFGRFLLPWMNSGLVLVDQAGQSHFTGVVVLAWWQRRSVVTAAREAGFEVEVYRTRSSAGGHIGSIDELDRFRRQHQATP